MRDGALAAAARAASIDARPTVSSIRQRGARLRPAGEAAAGNANGRRGRAAYRRRRARVLAWALALALAL
ncbi:hypothetical protein, partial [Burkholderia thailandensis]